MEINSTMTTTRFNFSVRRLSFREQTNIWWHLLLERSLRTARSIGKKKNKLNTNHVHSYSQSLSRSAQACQLCGCLPLSLFTPPPHALSQTCSSGSNTCATADVSPSAAACDHCCCHVSGPSEALPLRRSFDFTRSSGLSKQILHAYFSKRWSVGAPVARKSPPVAN